MDTYTLARGLQIARARKGAPLTPDEIAKIETLTNEVQRLEKEVEDLTVKNQKLNEARDAELAATVFKAEVAKARAGRKDKSYVAKLKAEQADILNRLTALGIRLNDVTEK